MINMRNVILLILMSVLQGCNDSFEALDCEWKRPDGYTDTVMSIGYGYIKLEMNRGEASPSIRFYEDLDPGVSGVTTSNFNRGALNVIYRKVPDDAQYLAGLESIEITREGFNDSVVINKEEIDTFLVGCK